MAVVRNGTCFSGEVIILSSSDEEESKPDNQGRISAECTQPAKQETLFPKIPLSSEFPSKVQSNESCTSNGMVPELSKSLNRLPKANATSDESTTLSNASKMLTVNNADTKVANSENVMANFFTVCQEFVDDEGGRKILQSVKKSYSSADTDFVHSKHFCDFINKKSNDISREPKKVFLHIKEVIDELIPYKRRKRLLKHKKPMESSAVDGLASNDTTDASTTLFNLNRTPVNKPSSCKVTNVECTTSSTVSKRQPREKHIRRLEHLLQKLDKQIKHLQKKELNFDDMDDGESIYIQEDRFKARFIKVFNKLCQLTGRPTTTGRLIEKKFHFNGSRYPEINEKISKFVNKEKIFPDYTDVLKLVYSVNEKLKLSDIQAQAIARDLFEEVGKLLRRRRCNDFKEHFGCYLTDNIDDDDPAEHDPSLKSALDESAKKASNDLDQLIDKFALRQVELKLEPEAVSDVETKSEHDGDDEEEDDRIEKDETSDIEFIEATVASDDENGVNVPKEDDEKENIRVCSSDEKSLPSVSSYKDAEENSSESSSSSSSQSLLSLDRPCSSGYLVPVSEPSNCMKRSLLHELESPPPLQIKMPCLVNMNSSVSFSDTQALFQKGCQSQNDDVIIVE